MIRLLIVDDQDLIRDGLTSILDRDEHIDVVGTAADGIEAVQLAVDLRPDVVLMDIRMPGITGVEATRRLLAASLPSRVIVLSTFDEDDLVVEAIRAGASGYLLKDIPRQHLVEAIKAVHEGDLRLAPSITRRLVERQLAGKPSPDHAARLAALSEREVDVLKAVAAGSTNAEIAAQLYLSESTIKTHVSHVLQKLRLRDRVQLVIFAYEAGVPG